MSHLPAGSVAPDLLYANTSVPAGNTVANTASETNFASNYAIAANTLRVGDVIRITAFGLYGSDAITPGTITLKAKAGSVVLATTGAITNVAALTNRGWMLQVSATVISLGASGTVEVQGVGGLSTALSTAAIADMENAAVVTVDTTAALTIQASVEMSVADTDNTVTLRSFVVELLR